MRIPIDAAGGVVYRFNNAGEPEVLLIYRNAVWDLPKGKLEKGESIEMCAVREVAEETGVELPMLVGNLGTTYHEYTQKNKYFGKTTYWFAMVLARSTTLVPQTEEGIERLEWVELGRAKAMVGYDNLKKVLGNFSQWIKPDLPT